MKLKYLNFTFYRRFVLDSMKNYENKKYIHKENKFKKKTTNFRKKN